MFFKKQTHLNKRAKTSNKSHEYGKRADECHKVHTCDFSIYNHKRSLVYPAIINMSSNSI